jgi:hypothetical protein
MRDRVAARPPTTASLSEPIADAFSDMAAAPAQEPKMQSHIPQNAEEAAYAGFALVATLLDGLVAKGILSEADVAALFATSVTRLQSIPNEVSRRAACFLRNVMGSEK